MSSISNPPASGDSVVLKSADQTVNNSDVLVADTMLKFTGIANSTYMFELFINTLSGTTPDLKYLVSGPTGSINRIVSTHYNGISFLADRILDLTTAKDIGCDGVTDGTHNDFILINGTITIGSTGGDVVFKWAQKTANVSDTKVKAGSWLRYRKL